MNTILLGVFSCLPFLQTNLPLDLIPKTFELAEYSEGQPVNSKAINTQNEFINFFKNNNKEWHCSNVTYVPQKLLFSKKMTINILKDMVVINYEDENGEHSQIVKNLNTEKLVKIINQQ